VVKLYYSVTVSHILVHNINTDFWKIYLWFASSSVNKHEHCTFQSQNAAQAFLYECNL